MFRDLKEYQEIAKIYAEKVSKSEDLDEMTGGLGVQGAQKMQKDIKSGDLKQKPVMEKKPKEKTFIEKGGALGAIKRLGSKVGNALKTKPIVREPGATSVRQSGVNDSRRLKQRQAEKQAAADKKEVDFRLKNTESSEQSAKADAAPERRKLTGKERAQAMAKARIKSGKTIQQVKDENKASMKVNALQRQVDFKAKRRKPPGEMKSNFAGGVSGKGKATDDFSKDPKYQSTAGTSTDIKKPVRQMGRSAAKRRQMMNNEEFTPYDIVLEYLLSSQQAATIEEANYIMTEMDAKTIQDIVS